MKKSILCTMLGAALLTSGCASIVSDSRYPVTINSAPDGANFVVTNKNGVVIHTGRTPSTITLKSGSGYFSSSSYSLTFKKDGYSDKTVSLESTMDGWYIGNILFGGLVGFLIVDPITGAMWKLPEAQSASLDEKVATIQNDSGLKIVSIDNVSDEMKQKMVEIK